MILGHLPARGDRGHGTAVERASVNYSSDGPVVRRGRVVVVLKVLYVLVINVHFAKYWLIFMDFLTFTCL